MAAAHRIDLPAEYFARHDPSRDRLYTVFPASLYIQNRSLNLAEVAACATPHIAGRRSLAANLWL
ncbi:MAG TPA: hypothetical protein VEC96_05885, partial [Anaerolineae bacterium]|nr:hypothetical protein [Anaerolineae bacterium]